MVRCRHTPSVSPRARPLHIPGPHAAHMPKLRLDRLHPLTPPSRIWQAQLPPLAPPQPPPAPPANLDVRWMADRLHHVGHFIDGMADGSLPGGIKFLSKAHGENTHAKAGELLNHALEYCKKYERTKADPIGSPVLWAILLAQQAHALQYGWGKGAPRLWDVRAMHALLCERQDQSVTLEGGSRAPRDTRAVGRGLGGEQQVRYSPPPPRQPGPHIPSGPLRAAGPPQQRGCAHAPAPRGRSR
jgi:hypothetical protein